jgi:hypothetical protein
MTKYETEQLRNMTNIDNMKENFQSINFQDMKATILKMKMPHVPMSQYSIPVIDG